MIIEGGIALIALVISWPVLAEIAPDQVEFFEKKIRPVVGVAGDLFCFRPYRDASCAFCCA
jgi:hypothetical protein